MVLTIAMLSLEHCNDGVGIRRYRRWVGTQRMRWAGLEAARTAAVDSKRGPCELAGAGIIAVNSSELNGHTSIRSFQLEAKSTKLT